MASVWKRLQRVNKRAAKFQYTASYHRVDLETSPKWKPNKLSVVWTRRSRRVITDPLEWEPSLKDPLKGSVIYTVPENRTVAVTLFKDSRTNELEDKDWTFVLEDVSVTGKRRRLAVCSINMRKYASLEPSQRSLVLTLDPVTQKIVAASIQLTLHTVLLREGQATDDDMQSLASLLSVNNNSDIAVLEDLDEDDYTLSDNSTRQMLDLRQQMEEMTQSLTNSDMAATPNSVQSLNFDNSRTPTAPLSPAPPDPQEPSTPVPHESVPQLNDNDIFEPIPKSRPEMLSNLTKMAMKPEPKFYSTPKQNNVPVESKGELKGVVFKPKMVAMRNLKPLELKTNLNSINLDRNENEKDEDSDKTPTAADMEKLFPGKFDKDKTPVQDLLEWCQSVTREYKSCRVTNLTTSFRSGLAFCAIIHRFRPDLMSFAYYSLKERLPVILTKIIDYTSREQSKIMKNNNATQEDVVSFMRSVTKLKNDLVTNKEYEPLRMENPNAKLWNQWIESQENKRYFLNSWMFTECYVYRRLKEGCELTKTLKEFDYFEEQKKQAFQNNIEIMCLVADKVVDMANISEKDKRKADFVTLLKICLWANKCDLSLSLGSQVDLIKAAKDATEKLRLNPPPPPPTKGKKKPGPTGPIIISADPFQMILDLKDKIIADDCNKIADQVVSKAQAMTDKVAAQKQALAFKAQCTCGKLAKQAGMPICEEKKPEEAPPAEGDAKAEGEKAKEAPAEPEKPIACLAKLTVPQTVMFDIVCDNAGYELFADMCLAHFLIQQKIVERVRFHVKNMPWFVSDVTKKDFRYLIDACCNAEFSQPSATGSVDEEGQPKVITSANLKALGQQWRKYVEDGAFMAMDEEYWTYPLCFKDMKKTDIDLYRKLQLAVAIMFKGDLNYRKLVGDVNCNPYTALQASTQGFLPAPIIAVRTVKAETVCGLPKGKYDVLNQLDPKWMQSGDYGVIQWCPKGEALKASDRPCIHYCKECFGVTCPEQFDI